MVASLRINYHTDLEIVSVAMTEVAVTIDKKLLAQVDRLVAEHVFPNRSKAVQAALQDQLRRIRHKRLAHESTKLNPCEEQASADEHMDKVLKEWPKY